MKLLLLGMNHRTAPVEVRERFAVPDLAPVLQKLANAQEIQEVVLVSTCNRVEVVATTHEPEAASLRLHDFFARGGIASSPVSVEPEQLYEYWILGRATEDTGPRWSVIRDVLGWVE